MFSSNSIDYDTQRGDLIRRALWHCIIMETSLHLELDLQPSGIVRLGEEVGMPSFNTPFCEADHRANQSTNFGKLLYSELAVIIFRSSLILPSGLSSAYFSAFCNC